MSPTRRKKAEPVDVQMSLEDGTTKRVAAKTVNKLSLGKLLKLAPLVAAEYTSSDLNDDDFARHATEKLGFAVNANHIGSMRRELEIPSLREVKRNRKPETIIERLEVLEGAILALQKRMDSWET